MIGGLALPAVAHDQTLQFLSIFIAYLISGKSDFVSAALVRPIANRVYGRLQAGS